MSVGQIVVQQRGSCYRVADSQLTETNEQKQTGRDKRAETNEQRQMSRDKLVETNEQRQMAEKMGRDKLR